MPNPIPLTYGQYYHIYNRGNNREDLFPEERNCRYFLELYARHIEPVAETYAYCLMRNHFHLLVRIRDEEDLTGFGKPVRSTRSPSQAFSNLFNAYTKAFNKTYGRTGTLFERPFHRRAVTREGYALQLVVYIHRNPQKHGFVDDFRDWPHTSYAALLSQHPTRVQREAVLEWFQGAANFVDAHLNVADDIEFGDIET